jgi:hypothetical protein
MTSAKDLRAKFADTYCKREGHSHGPEEAVVCAETLLAGRPGSTGLSMGLYPRAPPSLKEFYEHYCLAHNHAHDERSAILCVDLIYRQSIQALSRRIGEARERVARSRRPVGGAF